VKHDIIEKNIGLMIVLILVAISFGGLAQIVPLFFSKSVTEPISSPTPRCSWRAAISISAKAAMCVTPRWCGRCGLKPSATATTR